MIQSKSISRSGTTPYHVLINQVADVLQITLSGHWFYNDPKAFWTMVVRESQSRDLQHALIRLQLCEPLSIKEACELSGSANAALSNHDIRVAVVDSNLNSFPDKSFWDVAGSGCFKSELFMQLNDAEQWLRPALKSSNI
ncbi:MAG: hypothetical protein CO187_09365 [Zetaproteobacteria bacterium CG_4_9_14_3_um_filter_53_7]|nr:MAG: hypothetical protein CO187_09365 [Zetaproteobacteria bacterium CG_4_9_14_3_um_filter_53_7]